MISRLTGKLIEKQPPSAVIDVQGVGYEVLLPMSCFAYLPNMNESVSLFTQLIVREDSHTLYGFLERKERELFCTLLRVNGVGAKVALGILSAMDADSFVVAVHNQDEAQLVKLPGVGKKTAQRLCIELKDRLAAWASASSPQLVANNEAVNAEKEALEALVALGYKESEAKKRIQLALKNTDNESSEMLIRNALRH